MCAFRTIIQLLRQEASNMFRKGIFMPERELVAPNDGSDTVLSKYTAKDSVFTDLFRHPKYLLQLYQALHPEDTDASEDKINNITLKNVLLEQNYNDLGFLYGGRLVILVEAQSTWTSNILIRSLLYLAQTYQEYISATGQDIYRSKKVSLPEPELYVIYTGERQEKREQLSLTEEFFNNHACALEVKVKMIYDGKEGDIIHQYVTFTRVFNEQVRLHGRTRKAVLEAIRICENKNILKEYLLSREKEVISIMMTLFDDEYILRTHINVRVKEAVEEASEKAAKKATLEAENRARQTAARMYNKGIKPDEIAELLDVPLETVESWLNLTPIC